MKKKGAKKAVSKGSPVARAIKKMAPLPIDFLQALRLREWSAMEALQKGVGTISDVALLIEMLMMCEASIEIGIGPEAKLVCQHVTEILDGIEDNATCISLDDDQMKIIRELHAFHDQQREFCTIGDYEEMVKIVENKARAEMV